MSERQRRSDTFNALPASNVDLDNRRLVAKVTKNRHPQHFAINAGLVGVLRGWRKVLGNPAGTTPIVPFGELKLEGGGRAKGEGEKPRCGRSKRSAP